MDWGRSSVGGRESIGFGDRLGFVVRLRSTLLVKIRW